MIDVSTLTDVQVISRTLDGEAGNQGQNGQQGVGSVIQNRVNLKWQGETTARGVCLHHEQFDCWIPGDPSHIRITADDYVENLQCTAIAIQVLAGTLPDNTNGADSYEVTGTNAYWDKEAILTSYREEFVVGNRGSWI